MGIRRPGFLAVALLLSAGLTLWLFIYQRPVTLQDVPTALQGVMRAQPRQLEPFDLIDQHGDIFDLMRLEGGWSLVFFGYTYCPDICPGTLATLAATFNRLVREPGGTEDLQVIFVSVDPRRDTPEVLAGYMAYFSKGFTGVTGDKKEIDNLARQFGASYIIEPEHAPGEYLVSHASSIFLVNPQAHLIAGFSPPHDPANLVSQLRVIRTID